MFGRWIVAAGMGVVLLAGPGCSGPMRLGGTPAPVPGRDFTYEPMRVRSQGDVRAEAPRETKRPEPVPRIGALPEPDPSWEVPGWQRPWRWIVVHHSATHRGSAAAFDDVHRRVRRWDELGYHFVIGNGAGSANGEIEVGSRWPKQKHGAHCKVGQDETYNDFGIGICLVGNFENRRPSDAQMTALARLVDYLAARYKISDSHIIGHGDVDSTKCPGRYFSFDDLFRRLRRRRDARGAVVAPR